MKRMILIASLCGATLLGAGSLYGENYMSGSGVVPAPVSTGIPNSVDGRRLLHWQGYVTRLEPIYFYGNELQDDSELGVEQLRELLRENRSRIRYVSILGHSSAVIDEENRIDEGGWVGLWHGMSDGRISKEKAISQVNQRIRAIYDLVREEGIPSSKIYNENRLDRDPLYTEATSEGRAGNNRVAVALFSNGPLILGDLHINFALDSARILPGYDERIARFAKLLKRNPKMNVTIVGHTDRRGAYSYNIGLSKRRAESVKSRLVQLGIPASRIRTEGRGYTQPVAQGHNEAAYRQNRRIEAVLYR